jgi:hypothetical protein
MKYNKDTLIFISGIISYIILIIALLKKKYKIIFFYFLIFGFFFLFFQNFSFILAFLFLIIIIIISYLNIKEAADADVITEVSESVTSNTDEINAEMDKKEEEDLSECEKDVVDKVTRQSTPDVDTSDIDTASDQLIKEMTSYFDGIKENSPSSLQGNTVP